MTGSHGDLICIVVRASAEAAHVRENCIFQQGPRRHQRREPFFMINYSNEQKVNNGLAVLARCRQRQDTYTHNFYSNTPTEQLQFNGDLNFSPL